MPDYPDAVRTEQDMRAQKNIFAGPWSTPNLSTYADGAILETTLIHFVPGSIGTPYCYGAEYFHAVNLASTGGEMLPAGFVTETANQGGYHAEDDNLGVFGSYAYAEANKDSDPRLVGGMVLQASQQHEEVGGVKHLGTRLMLVYTPNGTETPTVGAMIDGDGTFAVAGEFQHIGGKVGFFNKKAVEQPPVPASNATVADVVAALVALGLVKTV